MKRFEDDGGDDSDNETDPEQLLNEWLGELDSLTVVSPLVGKSFLFFSHRFNHLWILLQKAKKINPFHRQIFSPSVQCIIIMSGIFVTNAKAFSLKDNLTNNRRRRFRGNRSRSFFSAIGVNWYAARGIYDLLIRTQLFIWKAAFDRHNNRGGEEEERARMDKHSYEVARESCVWSNPTEPWDTTYTSSRAKCLISHT